MAIDAYATCPGGTGKKIKFCCPDFVGELDKIERMLEGQQYAACLQHIERLLQQGEPRQCLMAIKTMLLRETNELEAAETYAEEFLRLYPENPLAWVESALLAVMRQSGRAALAKLLRAIALSGRELHNRVYLAIGEVAEALASEGDWFAARALWRLQLRLLDKNPEALENLVAIGRSNEVPLLLKDDLPLSPAPADAHWKPRFDEALLKLSTVLWQEAADQFAALAHDLPDEPVVWKNLATIRGWLADDEGMIEALRHYAALAVPADDAIEAEAIALMLQKDPLGDAIDLLRLSWPVADADRLQEALLSDRRLMQLPAEMAAPAEEGQPPPRMIAMLLDRPIPATADAVDLATMPRMLCQLLLFGRQTDREARLEAAGASAWDLSAIKDAVKEMWGDQAAEPTEQVLGHTSGSYRLLQAAWQPPRDMTQERFAALTAEHMRQAILDQWPELPLGVFGGKSPRAAATEPANHIRLQAAIMVLAHWCGRSVTAPELAELRSRLGLAGLPAIELVPGQIDILPPIRLSRLAVERLNDEDLLHAYRRATAFAARDALRKLAQAIVDRPSFADRPERFMAHATLVHTAEHAGDALENIERGRNAAQAAGQSCGPWDIMELQFRFGRGEGRQAVALMKHIQSAHLREKNIQEAFVHLLVDVGLLRPDGTPAMPPAGPQTGVPATGEEPAGDAARIWTPESQQPSGGKLWTPGA
jgi:hypothetical protein